MSISCTNCQRPLQTASVDHCMFCGTEIAPERRLSDQENADRKQQQAENLADFKLSNTTTLSPPEVIAAKQAKAAELKEKRQQAAGIFLFTAVIILLASSLFQ